MPFSPHGEYHLIKRESYSFHQLVKMLTFSPQGENKHIKNKMKTFHHSVKKLTFSPTGELGNIVKNTHMVTHIWGYPLVLWKYTRRSPDTLFDDRLNTPFNISWRIVVDTPKLLMTSPQISLWTSQSRYSPDIYHALYFPSKL